MSKYYSIITKIVSLIVLAAFILTQAVPGYALRAEQASGRAVGDEITSVLKSDGKAAANGDVDAISRIEIFNALGVEARSWKKVRQTASYIDYVVTLTDNRIVYVRAELNHSAASKEVPDFIDSIVKDPVQANEKLYFCETIDGASETMLGVIPIERLLSLEDNRNVYNQIIKSGACTAEDVISAVFVELASQALTSLLNRPKPPDLFNPKIANAVLNSILKAVESMFPDISTADIERAIEDFFNLDQPDTSRLTNVARTNVNILNQLIGDRVKFALVNHSQAKKIWIRIGQAHIPALASPGSGVAIDAIDDINFRTNSKSSEKNQILGIIRNLIIAASESASAEAAGTAIATVSGQEQYMQEQIAIINLLEMVEGLPIPQQDGVRTMFGNSVEIKKHYEYIIYAQQRMVKEVSDTERAIIDTEINEKSSRIVVLERENRLIRTNLPAIVLQAVKDMEAANRGISEKVYRMLMLKKASNYPGGLTVEQVALLDRRLESLRERYKNFEVAGNTRLTGACCKFGTRIKHEGRNIDVGGDGYIRIRIGEDKLLVAIVDVGGHDIYSAFIKAVVLNLFGNDARINELWHSEEYSQLDSDGERLKRLVEDLNKKICAIYEETQDDSRLVTAKAALVNYTDKKIYRVPAGGGLISFMGLNGEFEEKHIQQSGLPLGIYDTINYQCYEDPFNDKAYFMLFTDGAYEDNTRKEGGIASRTTNVDRGLDMIYGAVMSLPLSERLDSRKVLNAVARLMEKIELQVDPSDDYTIITVQLQPPLHIVSARVEERNLAALVVDAREENWAKWNAKLRSGGFTTVLTAHNLEEAREKGYLAVENLALVVNNTGQLIDITKEGLIIQPFALDAAESEFIALLESI